MAFAAKGFNFDEFISERLHEKQAVETLRANATLVASNSDDRERVIVCETSDTNSILTQLIARGDLILCCSRESFESYVLVTDLVDNALLTSKGQMIRKEPRISRTISV
jgi:hypothetical protein